MRRCEKSPQHPRSIVPPFTLDRSRMESLEKTFSPSARRASLPLFSLRRRAGVQTERLPPVSGVFNPARWSRATTEFSGDGAFLEGALARENEESADSAEEPEEVGSPVGLASGELKPVEKRTSSDQWEKELYPGQSVEAVHDATRLAQWLSNNVNAIESSACSATVGHVPVDSAKTCKSDTGAHASDTVGEVVTSVNKPALSEHLSANLEKQLSSIYGVAMRRLIVQIGQDCPERSSLLRAIHTNMRTLHARDLTRNAEKHAARADVLCEKARVDARVNSERCVSDAREEVRQIRESRRQADIEVAELKKELEKVRLVAEEVSLTRLILRKHSNELENVQRMNGRVCVELEATREKLGKAEVENSYLHKTIGTVEEERANLAEALLCQRRRKLDEQIQCNPQDIDVFQRRETFAEDRHAAATSIQRVWRGRTERIRMQPLLEQHRSEKRHLLAAEHRRLPPVPRGFCSLMLTRHAPCYVRACIYVGDVRRAVGKIYDEIIKKCLNGDGSLELSSLEKTDLPEFIYDFYLERCGNRDPAEMEIMNLLASLEKHKSGCPRLLMFRKFCNLELPQRVLVFFIRCFHALKHTTAGPLHVLNDNAMGVCWLVVETILGLFEKMFCDVPSEVLSGMLAKVKKVSISSSKYRKLIGASSMASSDQFIGLDEVVAIMVEAFLKEDIRLGILMKSMMFEETQDSCSLVNFDHVVQRLTSNSWTKEQSIEAYHCAAKAAGSNQLGVSHLVKALQENGVMPVRVHFPEVADKSISSSVSLSTVENRFEVLPEEKVEGMRQQLLDLNSEWQQKLEKVSKEGKDHAAELQCSHSHTIADMEQKHLQTMAATVEKFEQEKADIELKVVDLREHNSINAKAVSKKYETDLKVLNERLRAIESQAAKENELYKKRIDDLCKTLSEEKKSFDEVSGSAVDELKRKSNESQATIDLLEEEIKRLSLEVARVRMANEDMRSTVQKNQRNFVFAKFMNESLRRAKEFSPISMNSPPDELVPPSVVSTGPPEKPLFLSHLNRESEE
eukprot:928670_1